MFECGKQKSGNGPAGFLIRNDEALKPFALLVNDSASLNDRGRFSDRGGVTISRGVGGLSCLSGLSWLRVFHYNWSAVAPQEHPATNHDNDNNNPDERTPLLRINVFHIGSIISRNL
jgi:hypothetical protein